MLNLRHMEVFRAVMTTGGLRGAAELLHVSQPAVSKMLREMARQCGLTLFENVRGRLLPTPEARILFDEIEVLWRGVQRVRDVTDSLNQSDAGTLRVAATASLAPGIVSNALSMLYDEFPRAKCYLEVLIPALMVDELLDGSTHIGVCLLPNDHPNLVRERWYECGLVCVMHPHHELCAKPVITARDLIGQRVITSPESSAYGHLLRQAYGSQQQHMELTLEVRSATSACWLAQAGAGVALVDHPVIAGDTFPGLAFRPFRSRVKLTAAILRSRFRPMSRIQSAFCKALDTTWKQYLGANGPAGRSAGRIAVS